MEVKGHLSMEVNGGKEELGWVREGCGCRGTDLVTYALPFPAAFPLLGRPCLPLLPSFSAPPHRLTPRSGCSCSRAACCPRASTPTPHLSG